jgi:hypothetical protein
MRYSHKNHDLGFPSLSEEAELEATRKMPLHELPLQHRMDSSLAVIAADHPRIANAIDQFWGFQECDEYLTKLIYDGKDPKGHERAGFKSEVLSALLNLKSLHKVTAR